jgi:AraC-like DNA-binding protein
MNQNIIFRRYTPQSPLSAFVNQFWSYEGQQLPHLKERVLPGGSIELIINLRENLIRIYDRVNPERYECFRGAVVVGAHSEFFVIDTVSQQSLLGIHFKPGGAFPFFNSPVSELRNLHVGLESLWGNFAAELREELREISSVEARFQVLEKALLRQACRPLEKHPAVNFALKQCQYSGQTRNISEVSAQIGLSNRRFIEIFSQEVGLTPKLFWRVQRFQEALQLMRNGLPVRWAEIALTCGYFDQAHFIHDFQSFSGLNPTDYLNLHTEHHNHVPL